MIDDPREEKLYLVMDFVRKGAVMSDNYWKYEDNEAKKNQPLSTNEPEDKTLIDTDRKRPLSEEKALKYFRGLVLGLDYLHNYAHVIHRDIKPENLLIDHEDNLKISDFGVSYIMEDSTNDFLKNNAGTKCFLPPEAFAGNYIIKILFIINHRYNSVQVKVSMVGLPTFGLQERLYTIS